MGIRDLFKSGTDETKSDLPKIVTGKIVHLEKPSEKSEGGYGFIYSDDIPRARIYFHWHFLVPGTLRFDQLTVGMQVEFEPVDVPGYGLRAYKLKVIQ